jgi:transcriptional regulator with XRE-family HTH domain
MLPSAPRYSKRAGSGALGSLGAATAARRRELGLTQRELSQLSGVSERSIQALEAGKGSLQVDLLVRVLDAIGLSLTVVPRSQGRRLEEDGAVVVRLRPPGAHD